MARVMLAVCVLLMASVVLAGCSTSHSASQPEASFDVSPCEASFNAFPQHGYVPSNVQFTDKSVGDIDVWEWDLDGDGVVDSTSRNPRYTYSNPGTYTVSLTVKGPSGKSTETREAYLEFTSAPCTADFVDVRTRGEDGLVVRFTDQSTGHITAWAWDFDGDGETDSTQRNPTHTYTVYGVYSVSLAVTASLCEDTVTKAEYVEYIAPPEAWFTASPTTGQVPVEVQFIDQSTGDKHGWKWDFNGDGVVDSTAQNPEHTYSKPGTYTVSLTVVGPGGSDTETREGYLEFTPPPTPAPTPTPPPTPTPSPGSFVADFRVSKTTVEHPLTTVRFTDLSTGGIDTWAWDFDGDGKIDSREKNPSHRYTMNGTFTVTLTVTGPGGEETRTWENCVEVSGCPT